MKPLLILSILLSLSSIYLSFQVHDLKEKTVIYDGALRELSIVLTKAGIVVPDKEGKPTVNTLLLEAWKKSNHEER
jgi:hypothetical protein